MQHHFRRSLVGPILSFVVVTILTILALLIGVDRLVVLTSATFIALALLLLLISNIVAIQRIRRDVLPILAGAYWAHWRYEPRFWHLYAPTSWFGRTIRLRSFELIIQLRTAFLPALLLSGLGFWFTQQRGTTAQAIQVALIIGLAALISMVASAYLAYLDTQHISDGGTVDVYISPVGIYATDQPARLLRLQYPGVQLLTVTVEPGVPRFLRFEAQYRVGSGQAVKSVIDLPVPEGREHEAEEVAARFLTEMSDTSQVQANAGSQ